MSASGSKQTMWATQEASDSRTTILLKLQDHCLYLHGGIQDVMPGASIGAV